MLPWKYNGYYYPGILWFKPLVVVPQAILPAPSTTTIPSNGMTDRLSHSLSIYPFIYSSIHSCTYSVMILSIDMWLPDISITIGRDTYIMWYQDIYRVLPVHTSCDTSKYIMWYKYIHHVIPVHISCDTSTYMRYLLCLVVGILW